jgi:chromate transporter
MSPAPPTDTTPYPATPGTLFLAFARVGMFTFGGGYAMLPMLEREIIERRHWATPVEINDIFAMSQTVPGAIAINAATFIGKRWAGIPGAIAATAGMITPSFVIILALAILLQKPLQAATAAPILQGIRGAVAGLIAAVAFNSVKRNCHNVITGSLAVTAAVLALLPGVNVVWIILGAGAVGAIRHFYRR